MIREKALYAVLTSIILLSGYSIAIRAQQSSESQQPKKAAAETIERKGSLRYGLFGKMTAHPGKRDAVVAILLREVEELRAVGCDLYVVNLAPNNPDVVWISEVWRSREAHRASLQLPSVKRAIAEARPMLTGEFEQIEVDVVGGLGLPPSPETGKPK
jgi:quinol monooxygenase YgiN